MEKYPKDKIKRYSLWAVASLCVGLVYKRIYPLETKDWNAFFAFLGMWGVGYVFLMFTAMGAAVILVVCNFIECDSDGERVLLIMDTAAAILICATCIFLIMTAEVHFYMPTD